MLPLQITVALRVDSFATYAYTAVAFTRWSFYCFRLKNKNNSSGQMQQLYAYVANKYTLKFRTIDLFSCLHSIFCFLSFLPPAFSVATGKRWSCKEAQCRIYSRGQKWPGVTLKHDSLLRLKEKICNFFSKQESCMEETD